MSLCPHPGEDITTASFTPTPIPLPDRYGHVAAYLVPVDIAKDHPDVYSGTICVGGQHYIVAHILSVATEDPYDTRNAT